MPPLSRTPRRLAAASLPLAAMLLCVVPVSAADERFPLPAGVDHINVRDLGARGDDDRDDTAALQKAIGGGERYKLVYIPDGTYLVSEPIDFGQRRVWVHGESRDGTVIKLRDHAPGFQDGSKPRPVLSTWAAWDREKFPNTTSAVIFRQELYNLTIDVGEGNPAAAGLIYHTSNQGRVKNVRIRSGDPDGHGAFGLGLTIPWPGPGLLDDLVIEGFEYGIYSTVNQYSLTFKNLTLRHQRKAGVFNREQTLLFDGLTSEQRPGVPVIDTERSQVVVLDGRFTGGGETAIDARRTMLYLRGVEAEGYDRVAEVSNGEARKTAEGPSVDEFISGRWNSLFGEAEGSLRLERRETPEPPWGPMSGWATPDDFGRTGGKVDSSVAFQKAIDSGAHTIYFGPKSFYRIDNPIIVRGNVRRIIGFGGRLSAEAALGDRPIFVIRGDEPVVVFERMAQHARHRGPAFFHDSDQTVVLRSMIVNAYVANRPGDLFVEDVSMTGWRLIPGQRAWMWQLNPEARGDNFNVDNRGAALWLMGVKTEGGRTTLTTRDAGLTEVLGSYIYNNRGYDQRVNFVVDEAAASFVANNSDFPVAVAMTHDGETLELPGSEYTGFFTTPAPIVDAMREKHRDAAASR